MPDDGVALIVDAVATFDSEPNTALRLNVPLNGTSWTSYFVARVRPRMVHVWVLPVDPPASGVAQVPRATLVAEPQPIGLTA